MSEEINNAKLGILHVCGGDPKATRAGKVQDLYSPRMWR